MGRKCRKNYYRLPQAYCDKYYAFLDDGPRRFRRVEVKVGADSGGAIEILGGMVAGQKVVVEGSLFLLRIQRQLETGAPV